MNVILKIRKTNEKQIAIKSCKLPIVSVIALNAIGKLFAFERSIQYEKPNRYDSKRTEKVLQI